MLTVCCVDGSFSGVPNLAEYSTSELRHGSHVKRWSQNATRPHHLVSHVRKDGAVTHPTMLSGAAVLFLPFFITKCKRNIP